MRAMAANTGAGEGVMPTGRQGGFAYMMILILIVIMGMGLTMVGTQWDLARQREREQELLSSGNQIRRAIERYYQQDAVGMKRYPAALDDLLKDPRLSRPERYLRRPLRDPITGADWGLVVAPEGGIMGVFSKSEQMPLKRANFHAPDQIFEAIALQRGDQLRYTDWQFVYRAQPLLPQTRGVH